MKKFLLFFVFAGPISSATIETTHQKDLSMVIYNQNYALVTDVRQIPLQKGLNHLTFNGISDNLIPTSVLLQGSHLNVIEQNFNSNILNKDNLFKENIGKTVTVEYIHPLTGKVETQSATLLSYTSAQPVLKIGQSIETSYPGRVIFNHLPDNLYAHPTLQITATSTADTTDTVSLTYLTHDISWNTDYIAYLSDRMDLSALITINNNTDTLFNNAQISVLAGQVNFDESSIPVREYASFRTTAMNDMATSSISEESVSGYHLFELDKKITLQPKQSKQVSFFPTKSVAYTRKNVYTAGEYVNQFKNQNPTHIISFKNEKSDGLGFILPKGKIRFYSKSSDGHFVFLGSQNLSDTALGQTVDLTIGDNFDLLVSGKRTDYKKAPEIETFQTSGDKIITQSYTETYEFKFKNTSSENQNLRFYKYMPTGYQLTNQSQVGIKESANKVYWDMDLKANTEETLSFSIKISKQLVYRKGKLTETIFLEE